MLVCFHHWRRAVLQEKKTAKPRHVSHSQFFPDGVSHGQSWFLYSPLFPLPSPLFHFPKNRRGSTREFFTDFLVPLFKCTFDFLFFSGFLTSRTLTISGICYKFLDDNSSNLRALYRSGFNLGNWTWHSELQPVLQKTHFYFFSYSYYLRIRSLTWRISSIQYSVNSATVLIWRDKLINFCILTTN